MTFEQQARSKLLTEQEKRDDSHIVEFRREALLRADLATRTAAYVAATGGRAWMTPDEVRARENMNTVGGAQSEIIDPTNNFAPQPAPEPDEEDGGDDNRDENSVNWGDALQTAESVMAHVKARMMKRLRADMSRAPDTFWGSVDTRHGNIIKEELEHPAQMLRVLTGEENPAGRVMDEMINELREVTK